MRLGTREILFLAAMIALLASAYFLVFTKADRKRTALLAQLADRQKTLNDVRATTAGIDDFGQKIAELQKAIEFFEKKLPSETEMNLILEEATNKAEGNSLVIKTVKPLKVEKSAGYNELPIEMTLLGDFNNFYEFLLEVERMPRLTRVNKLRVEKIDNQDGQTQAQMTLSIFFEPDAPADAAGKAAAKPRPTPAPAPAAAAAAKTASAAE